MTEFPTSYLALTRQAGCTMLSRSATFQALLAVGSGAEALGRVIETWGGMEIEVGEGQGKATDGTLFALVAPYAIVSAQARAADFGGVGEWDRSGSVEITILVPGLQAGETPADFARRVANVIDGAAADLEAMLGQPGCLATYTVSSQLEPLPDETSANRDCAIGHLTIDWRG